MVGMSVSVTYKLLLSEHCMTSLCVGLVYMTVQLIADVCMTSVEKPATSEEFECIVTS